MNAPDNKRIAMKKQRYIVEIEMPDGDFISAEWLKDLIQKDCDVEDEGREKITVQVQETSLPSNLDEAADKLYPYEEMYDVELPYPSTFDGNKYERDAFKAGAEWMAGQGVRAHCIESANPVSESSDARPRLITLLYEENERTPYVRGGDYIDIIIRKK